MRWRQGSEFSVWIADCGLWIMDYGTTLWILRNGEQGKKGRREF